MKYVIEFERIITKVEQYQFEVKSKEEMYDILKREFPSNFGKCIKKSIEKIEEKPIRKVKEEQ